jgi:hypothetical protein
MLRDKLFKYIFSQKYIFLNFVTAFHFSSQELRLKIFFLPGTNQMEKI